MTSSKMFGANTEKIRIFINSIGVLILKKYKLGLVSISFRKNTVEEIFEAVKNAGLTCIEWGSDVHAPFGKIEKLKKIAKLQKEYGIECCSYGTYFKLGATPIEELEAYIKAAKILGTDILRLWCGEKSASEYSEKEKKELFEICKAAAKIAEEHNVKLCMECHNFTFTDTKETALKLMKAVNSPAFRMYWQPNQYTSTEENLDYAELLRDYTEHLHVFNWKGETRFPLEEAVDLWKKYLEILGEDKHLLLEFMPDDKIETLPLEAETLRKIVERKL